MEFPPQLRYTTSDEWLHVQGREGVVGITDHAQDQLGDIVFVELPEIGRQVKRGEAFGVIESVKAVCDLHTPVDGEVIARNDALTDAPELVNRSPYADGWMIRLRLSDPAQATELRDAAAYQAALPAAPAH
ncbi:MAG: glycine cleavage system protein GcvH [Dehalococcoidia bacterium]|nr:glycine cleavage system protein GcvH [Dehalococcoidia bacterium]